MRSTEAPTTTRLERRHLLSNSGESADYIYAPRKVHMNMPAPSPQVQPGETEPNYPFAPRWETPKSTIQTEDLLFFGIGSQFDDKTPSPRRLSFVTTSTHIQHSVSSTRLSLDPKVCSPVGVTTSTMSSREMPLHDGYQEDDDGREFDAYGSEETFVSLDNGEDLYRPLLLYDEKPLELNTTTGISKPGSYLCNLPKTLASTMRRVLAGAWNLLRWKICGGLCVVSSGHRFRHHGQQKQQGGEKLQEVRRPIYLT
ncbi:uncharacterized protein PG986_002989 [Apiospora aurea]|uniref:Uncharacterized protein n=1 Tax=Apiospora aurea TaxID=335848 RepID=A0ABR1QQD9_9PEZI